MRPTRPARRRSPRRGVHRAARARLRPRARRARHRRRPLVAAARWRGCSSRSCAPVGHGCAVDAEHAVACAQAGALRPAPSGHHLAEHRLAVAARRCRCAASAWHRPRGVDAGSQRRARRRALAAPVGIADAQLQRARRAARPAVSCQRRSVIERTSAPLSPSTDRALHPVAATQPGALGHAARPAAAPSSAFGSSTPIQCDAAYSSTASNRLASGPAATMAARCRSGWRLKARRQLGRRHRALALVEHLHVAAERQATSTNSVRRACAGGARPRGRSRPRSAAP